MADGARGPGRPRGADGRELLDLARAALLEHGFSGATMADIAARAKVSKASLYREHPSKGELFAAVVTDWAERGRGAMRPALDAMLAAEDLRAGLVGLLRAVQAGTLDPQVSRMRRLVAAESDRFPDVAAHYLAESWDANIAALAEAIRALDERGDLQVPDARLASEQLTWSAIGAPLNEQTLRGPDVRADDAMLASLAEEAVAAFLARYGVEPPATRLSTR